ncbi:hypothetical protein PR202_gb08448 [Eleusine coracana subsp. coracana]|uniref:F-box/LRR-repeat protein 15/At3g58940/PEG3-like LRR domain-containing protein n=1 Tax=Eleusine coracana subsp. coracana TaxID=191504 RepID=A0AAV5EE88_ELECO|nr:hypothetical protein PR202_gb08448 [Eleusine coracana subsp. coracana]
MDILTTPGGVADAVSRALAAHPGPFRCIYLAGTPMDAHRSEAALWLQLLAAKRVQDLLFVNRATKFAPDLELPVTLFKCSSLTRLYLGYWKFPGTAALPRVAAFPYLQELGLSSVAMEPGDRTSLSCWRDVGTKASPSTTVPSVKMLGVHVKFVARNEARMLPSFLRCFPNIETLYVQSEDPEFKIGHRGPQPGCSGNDKLDLKLWEEASPIECVQRHIKKLILHECCGYKSQTNT